MANQSLSFKKYASKPTADSSVSKGDIIFVTDEKTIYVAEDATVASLKPFYGGNIKDVTLEHRSGTSGTDLNYLTISLFEGNPIILDFSDIASMSNVDDLITALRTELKSDISSVDTKAGVAQETANAAQSQANANKTTLQSLTPGLIRKDDQTKGTAYILTLKSDEAEPVVDKNIDITTIVNDFIKDSFLDGTALITATATSQKVTINGTSYNVTGLTVGQTYIVFAWISQDGKAAQALNVTTLIDTYTAGDGLTLSNNKFSVKGVTPIVVGSTGVLLKYNDTLMTENSALGVNQTGVESWIDAKINALDATVNNTAASSGSTASTQIKTTVTETDGKLTNVSVVAPAFIEDVTSGDDTTLSVTKNNNNKVTVTPNTVSVKDATERADGLALASDIKSYVDTSIKDSISWTVFS